jgi:hypothetical protein
MAVDRTKKNLHDRKRAYYLLLPFQTEVGTKMSKPSEWAVEYDTHRMND